MARIEVRCPHCGHVRQYDYDLTGIRGLLARADAIYSAIGPDEKDDKLDDPRWQQWGELLEAVRDLLPKDKDIIADYIFDIRPEMSEAEVQELLCS